MCLVLCIILFADVNMLAAVDKLCSDSSCHSIPTVLLLASASITTTSSTPANGHHYPLGDAQDQSKSDGSEDLQKRCGPRQHCTRDQPAAEALPPQHCQVTALPYHLHAVLLLWLI